MNISSSWIWRSPSKISTKMWCSDRGLPTCLSLPLTRCEFSLGPWMSYLLKSATVVTLDPPSVELADLRIVAGRIVERGSHLDPLPENAVIDLTGKLIMPGMVCAHTH